MSVQCVQYRDHWQSFMHTSPLTKYPMNWILKNNARGNPGTYKQVTWTQQCTSHPCCNTLTKLSAVYVLQRKNHTKVIFKTKFNLAVYLSLKITATVIHIKLLRLSCTDTNVSSSPSIVHGFALNVFWTLGVVLSATIKYYHLHKLNYL